MFSEKEIVGMWLNNQGYLVLKDINAGKNKIVDAIAFRLNKEESLEAVHVEVCVSVAGPSDESSKLQSKFYDPLIIKTIKDIVKRLTGREEYKRLLVLNSSNERGLEDIKIVPFEDVLLEVIQQLDKQNYPNPTIRTLQLLKYLLLLNPYSVSKTLPQMTRKARVKLINTILTLPETKRVYSKNTGLAEECVKTSGLAKPEQMASFLVKNFSKRSFNQFLKELFKHEKAKRFTKKTSPRQRSLKVYLS